MQHHSSNGSKGGLKPRPFNCLPLYHRTTHSGFNLLKSTENKFTWIYWNDFTSFSKRKFHQIGIISVSVNAFAFDIENLSNYCWHKNQFHNFLNLIFSRFFWDLLQIFQPLHTVSFEWFLSGLERILNLEFCLLKLLIFYQKLLWNIRSRLNSSTFSVFFSQYLNMFDQNLHLLCTKL